MASKPASLPLWNSSGTNRVEPSGGRKAAGFSSGGDIPGSGELNWWLNLVYQWAAYLDDLEGNAHTWTAAHTFSNSATFSSTSTFNGATEFNDAVTFNDVTTFTDFVEVEGTVDFLALVNLESAVNFTGTLNTPMQMDSAGTYVGNNVGTQTKLCQDNIAKAWGNISVTTGTVTVIAGFNTSSSASGSGNDITVAFASGGTMADTNYSVQAQVYTTASPGAGTGRFAMVHSRTTNGFKITVMDAAGDPVAASGTFNIFFQVFGKQ